MFFNSSTNDALSNSALPPILVALVTVISAAPSLNDDWTESSIPAVMRPNATIVAIPIAIPIMDNALRVLFLKGFFKINVKNLIIIPPYAF